MSIKLLWERRVFSRREHAIRTIGETSMARLRHFAVCVNDLDKAAAFYQAVFDLKRIAREDLEIGSAIYMSDGVINLALLNFKGSQGSKASDLKNPNGFVGAHHFGFQVDDLAETQKRIEANGGHFFFDLGSEREGNFERKFKDPDGVIFDISKRGWQGTDSYSKGHDDVAAKEPESV
jgi:predicted enzyme related to lactoylglutathione lyase